MYLSPPMLILTYDYFENCIWLQIITITDNDYPRSDYHASSRSANRSTLRNHCPLRCPGSGVVLDCIDSLSLHSFLLWWYSWHINTHNLLNQWQVLLYWLRAWHIETKTLDMILDQCKFQIFFDKVMIVIKTYCWYTLELPLWVCQQHIA